MRTFVAVAEQGTVSKASLLLHVAQPALSRQINDLEQELGVRLFDRIRRRLILTGEGDQLLSSCRAILGAVGSLKDRAQGLQRADTGVLKIGATAQMIDGVLADFLRRYADRFPKVQIKLTEVAGIAMLTMLERGELHIGFASLKYAEAEEHSFGSLLLPPVEVLAAYHTSLELGTKGNVEVRRLASYPLLLLDTRFFIRQTFDAACRLAGLRPNIFVESRTPHTLLSLAEAGHGVAIVASILPTHRYRLRIARLTHRRKPLREPFAVLWDKRRTLPAYAENFGQSLATYMGEIGDRKLGAECHRDPTVR